MAADGTWQATFTAQGGNEDAPGPATIEVSCTDGHYLFDYHSVEFDLTTGGRGYWLVTRSPVQKPCSCTPSPDSVVALGDTGDFGSVAVDDVHAAVVGLAADPTTGNGYWMATADGGVFTYGSLPGGQPIRFLGSLGGRQLNAPIVGIAATPTGAGYWLVAADGGVFAFGDAVFAGSLAGIALRRGIVGIAPTTSGRGYWLAAGDGGVFAFGDAVFAGSAAQMQLARPVVGIAPADGGYWLAAADGGVFAFGGAPFAGSAVGMALPGPIVGIANYRGGRGYWLAGRDGSVLSFGDAPFAGSCAGCSLVRGTARNFVGISSSPVTNAA